MNRDPDTGKIVLTSGVVWVIGIICAVAGGILSLFVIPAFVSGISIEQSLIDHRVDVHSAIDDRITTLEEWGPITGPRLTGDYRVVHEQEHAAAERRAQSRFEEILERLATLETLARDEQRSRR